MARLADVTSTQRKFAGKIEKTLEDLTYRGRRQSDIFGDWLALVSVSLERLPPRWRQAPYSVAAHAKSAVQSGELAPQTDEERKTFERVRQYYEPRDFEVFTEAFAYLLESASFGYMDVLGQVYMDFAYPSASQGQYFTPFPVANMMAAMSGPTEADVHERLQAAIAAAPEAEAALWAGMGGSPEAARSWFISRVVPLAVASGEYEPVTVCDPACGSGVMLLAAASNLPAWMVQLGLVQFYGQDIDRTCVQMARANCRLYGLNGLHVKWALALSEAELAALPAPHGNLYREAQEAHEAGDEERVSEIEQALRAGETLEQMSMFEEVA